MKQIDAYITEKLHLNKDIKKIFYVIIFEYLEEPKCDYAVCYSAEEAVDKIKTLKRGQGWHDVYKMENLDNLDLMFASFWTVPQYKQKAYLENLGIEKCNEEILDLI